MTSRSHIRNVAIVGAAGNSGKYMTGELLATGKHVVTAITRIDSQSKFPEDVKVARVDYKDQNSLVEALQGQDALVITMNVFADQENQLKALFEAAGHAGVEWILPNERSPDNADEGLVRDIPIFQKNVAARKLIEELGHSSYIGVVTGFWYEWSLAIGPAFGIDIGKREATLFDEGETKISTSTWPQVGRAVAALLSLPVRAEGGAGACLEQFRNQMVYVKSFTVSQKDMLESVMRVTGTDEVDWHITKQSSQERYDSGMKAMQEGDRSGFVRMMYTRVFFPDGSGDHESRRGVANRLLGLPEEDIDEATRAAVRRTKEHDFGAEYVRK
ncbi:hypothetical protein CKM354_000578900 [Cercospora kikuchii]|uniref:NmrA-like domain-containing protein n=1 Tax=Cercospora kikuchii TaxID=84275 RepID=A0A9P3FHK7_9PEZI|nr:uncharacterized protein CKM354_000578900 [Cercospora kikuchii]GIZ42525.1 hypothetical protein CKM354_000578900 [Cercospora kikuchii]